MRRDTIQMNHQTCRQCGHVFYFEAPAEGRTLRCPDCREATRLRVADTPAESVTNVGTAVLIGLACLIGLKIVGLGFLLLVFLVGWPALLIGGLIFGVSLIVNAFKSDKPPKRNHKRTRIVESESFISRRIVATDVANVADVSSASPPQEPQEQAMYRFECPVCFTENAMTEAKRGRIAGRKFACRECGTVKRVPWPVVPTSIGRRPA